METEIAQLGGHSLHQLHVTGPALRAERRDDSCRDDDAADWSRWEHRKVLAAQSKERTAVAIGEKAERADADEALRQYMQEEAPQEFFGGNRHLPLLVMAGIVLPAEGDMGSVEGKNAGVGNGDTMSVAGQITKHLLRTGERAFGVDNPFARIGLPAELVKGGGMTETGEAAVELEFPLAISGGQKRQEFAAKNTAEHLDWKQESAAAGRDPLRAIGRQTAARYHAVQMRMMLEGLSPGVEDGEQAELRPKVFGIGGDFQECLGGGPEQDAIDGGFVLEGHRSQLLGKGKDDMKIGTREQITTLAVEPFLARRALALGTVAVAAGIVRDDAVSAAVAGIEMAAEDGGAAVLDGL